MLTISRVKTSVSHVSLWEGHVCEYNRSNYITCEDSCESREPGGGARV